MKDAAELTPVTEPAPIEAVEQVTQEIPVSSDSPVTVLADPAVQVEEPKAVAEETQEVASESAPVTLEVASASPETDLKPEETLPLEAAPAEEKAEAVKSTPAVLETAPEVVAQVSEPEINIEAPKELVEPGDTPQAITIVEEKSEEAIIAAESPSDQSNPDLIVPEKVQNESSVAVDTKSAHIWNDLGRTG